MPPSPIFNTVYDDDGIKFFSFFLFIFSESILHDEYELLTSCLALVVPPLLSAHQEQSLFLLNTVNMNQLIEVIIQV